MLRIKRTALSIRTPPTSIIVSRLHLHHTQRYDLLLQSTFLWDQPSMPGSHLISRSECRLGLYLQLVVQDLRLTMASRPPTLSRRDQQKTRRSLLNMALLAPVLRAKINAHIEEACQMNFHPHYRTKTSELGQAT